ncbi:MAG: thiamine-phosphate kinase [Dehalococcoidales bacterium]|nr:thiamine-phosphate kinase [Dehalococcoidales bacterium]
MKVSELGEFGLIDLLAKMIPDSQAEKPVIGIGDDAAAWHSDAPVQLATVDTMIQGVHFSLDTVTWKELGWKSLAINLSDIAAMGGTPQYALVALALPEDTEVEDVAGLYEGMIELAGQFRVGIIGGNVSRSPVVSITITVLGDSLSNEILKRSTARPGDTIAITGYPGSAAAGLEMLTKKLQFGAETATYLRSAFMRPKPRITEGQLLLKLGITTAIDTSDGLLADLRHICEASGVSARVDVDRLPIHPAVSNNFGERARELALSGGEDYELLFTGSAEIVERVRAQMEYPVTAIGEITAGEPGKISVVDADGNPAEINKAGWEHF